MKKCLYTTRLDEGENVLVIFIDDLDKVCENKFFQDICRELEQSTDETEKVIFKITDKDGVFRMKSFVRELQRRHFMKSLPLSLEKLAANGKLHRSCELQFWPDSWFIHVFIQGYWNNVLTAPVEIWTLPKVEVISCVQCSLQEIPNYISQMNCLKILNVSNNELKSLPTALSLCKTLEELDVSNNSQLKSLPACIAKMDALQRIARLSWGGVDRMVINDLFPSKGTNTHGDESNEGTDEQTKNSSPESLFNLAAFATFKTQNHVLLPGTSQKLPYYVMNDVLWSLKTLKFCDHCNRAFSDKQYKTIKKQFRRWKGYNNLVFEAVACSDFCCEAIYEDWLAKANIEQREEYKVQYSFDVEPNCPGDDTPVISSPRQGFYRKFLCFYSKV